MHGLRQFIYGMILVITTLLVVAAIGLLLILALWYPPSWLTASPVIAAPGMDRFPHTPMATRTPFLPLPITPTHTPTPTPSPTPTFTPTPTETPIPTNTPSPQPVTEDVFPPSQARVWGVVGFPQQYNLDCESRSAVDLAAFFDIQIDQMEFQSRLPLSDDPEEGYVGDFRDPQGQIPPNSYGVHAPPVADLLRSYGLNARAVKGLYWDDLRRELAFGRPVMVWIIYNTVPGTSISYTASNGNTTTVARYEHTAILVGYTPHEVTLVDGGMTYRRTVAQFWESWSVLGNMAVLVTDPATMD
ncbi:MAG: C39 family peptidase [Anaerolineaceae bacterium]|nr:C39 family peptidase [Anaerolineaceae bacterium]